MKTLVVLTKNETPSLIRTPADVVIQETNDRGHFVVKKNRFGESGQSVYVAGLTALLGE